MPSDSANLRPGHGQDAQRVCVLGNSYIAAVKQAYAENGACGYEFAFFGGGGKGFTDLNISGNSIVGITYHDGGSTDIRDYDIFVIYGGFPTPASLIETAEKFRKRKYSEQYMELILRELISRYVSSRLSKQLSNAGASNVFLLSKNFRVIENVGTSLQNDEGTALIRKLIEPAIYIPHPEVITSRGGHPPEQYYKGYQPARHHRGSPDTNDQEPDSIRERSPLEAHFNLAGGAIMLSTIVEFLNSFRASDTVGAPAQCSPGASISPSPRPISTRRPPSHSSTTCARM